MSSKIIARKITLVVAGKSEGAFEDALAEATRLVNQGNLSGMNNNREGGFYFNSDPDVPDSLLPRMG
ncbi:hypothetical protein [Ottowia sp.]|uniref:hypothetical protein n=1 Tax=Ottowia sp. TaxID=1898956 RepID=UPI0025D26333|nr:hypothetical protein [Ottowia sp.]MBK6616307.1 hypothetical protein [Ottowia sp.]